MHHPKARLFQSSRPLTKQESLPEKPSDQQSQQMPPQQTNGCSPIVDEHIVKLQQQLKIWMSEKMRIDIARVFLSKKIKKWTKRNQRVHSSRRDFEQQHVATQTFFTEYQQDMKFESRRENSDHYRPPILTKDIFTSSNSQDPSPALNNPDKRTLPKLPKSFSIMGRTITEEQRVKLRQQLKEWAKNNMRAQIRQEVLCELLPELKRQFRKKVKEMIGMVIQIVDGNYQASPQLKAYFNSNQSIVQRQKVAKRLPEIIEQPQEQQQDIEQDRSRSNSPNRDRTPETMKRKQRKRKNASKSQDSADSQDSSDSSSSEEQKRLVQKIAQFAIDTSIALYRKQLFEEYIIIPRRKD